MAQKKISQLPSVASVTNSMFFPVVQSGVTKRVTMQALKAAIDAGIMSDLVYTHSGNVATSKSVRNDTETSLGNITFDAFYGVVVCNITWASNATGYRSASVGGVEASVNATSGMATRMQVIRVCSGSETSLNVTVKQNSGAALNCTCSYRLVGIKKA